MTLHTGKTRVVHPCKNILLCFQHRVLTNFKLQFLGNFCRTFLCYNTTALSPWRCILCQVAYVLCPAYNRKNVVVASTNPRLNTDTCVYCMGSGLCGAPDSLMFFRANSVFQHFSAIKHYVCACVLYHTAVIMQC